MGAPWVMEVLGTPEKDGKPGANRPAAPSL